MSKNLKIEDLVACIDTRESIPLCLDPLKTKRVCLKTGDYSIEGCEDKISIELKELPDFIACCTFERERFEAELLRMKEYPFRAIVIKSTWGAIERGEYRSKTRSAAVFGSAMAFALSSNVSIIMAEDHQKAGILVARLLWVAANRLHRSSSLSSSV